MKRMKQPEMLRYVTTEALKYDKMESTRCILNDFIEDCDNIMQFLNYESNPLVIAITGRGLAVGSGNHVTGRIVEFESEDEIIKMIMIFQVKNSDDEYGVVEFKRI